MEESRQLAEFLRQLVSSPKRGDAHLGLLSVGVLAALGWLALACGIFGAINGRQQYLFWSRRILSLLVLFIALWWAWTRAEAQAPSDKSPNPTLQAPPLGGWPLAQRQE
jgi:ABC-type nickel/cobalt efflux system permease component RcnA